MNTSRLDAEIRALQKGGIILPRHPRRAMADAQEYRSMIDGARSANERTLRDIDENTRLIQKMGRQRRLSSFQKRGAIGGSDVYAAMPRFYDPLEYWDLSGLPWNMADEGHRHKLHKWLRLFYATHYLVPILIDIFTRFPLVGMDLECKDSQLVKYYEEVFFDKLDYSSFMVSMGREIWTVGECFSLGSFNDYLGIWEREELINPEDVIVKNFPLLGSQQLLINPPAYLRKLAQEKSPAKEYKQLEINFPELIPYLIKNEHIPVSDVLLRQTANKISDWDDHGTPILLRALRTLMHEEKLLASQDAIAERLYSPLILAKLGAMDLGDGQGAYIPTPDELEQVRDDLDIALSSDFRLMVNHFALDIENVFGREQMPRLGDDFDRVERRVMQTMGISPQLLGGGSATMPYASSALHAEFMNQMLRTYQNMLKRHFRDRALVIAEAQEHYDYEMRGSTKVPVYEEVVTGYDDEGAPIIETKPKLLVPELEFSVLDLRDEATERQFLQTLRTMGVPISDQKLMVGVNFNVADEEDDYNEELVRKTVKQQEAKMKTYKILQTRNLPIPPDLKAEVESVLTPPGMTQAPPMGAGGGMGGGGGGGLGMLTGPNDSGLPGSPIMMPPVPPGLGPTPGNPGAPPATPQPAGGPGGGTTAPPVSMERRPGAPKPAFSSTHPQSFDDPRLNDVNQWRMYIGGPVEANDVRDWIMAKHPDVVPNVLSGVSQWEGSPDNSHAVTMFSTPKERAQQILDAYGADHPNEWAFGVEPHGYEGFVWDNPHRPENYGQLAMDVDSPESLGQKRLFSAMTADRTWTPIDGSRREAHVGLEGWLGSPSLLPQAEGREVSTSSWVQSDELVSLGSDTSSPGDIAHDNSVAQEPAVEGLTLKVNYSKAERVVNKLPQGKALDKRKKYSILSDDIEPLTLEDKEVSESEKPKST